MAHNNDGTAYSTDRSHSPDLSIAAGPSTAPHPYAHARPLLARATCAHTQRTRHARSRLPPSPCAYTGSQKLFGALAVEYSAGSKAAAQRARVVVDRRTAPARERRAWLAQTAARQAGGVRGVCGECWPHEVMPPVCLSRARRHAADTQSATGAGEREPHGAIGIDADARPRAARRVRWPRQRARARAR